MAVVRFTLADFTDKLDEICESYGWKAERLGLVQHNYAFLIDIGVPAAKIMVYSSVAGNGISRDDGEDSIRAWIVGADGKTPIGGKTQSHVKRKANWAIHLDGMLAKIYNLARWLQPCPKCGQTVRMAVRGEKVFIFCPEDAKTKDAKTRHVAFLALDKKTGEKVD